MCVLSSANAMLPFLVGLQKPALAENQLQVRSLALTLSVSWPEVAGVHPICQNTKKELDSGRATEVSNGKSESDEKD